MSSRLFQFVAAAILFLVTFTPVTEAFDRGDKNPNPATDTEMTVTALFVGVGLALTLAKLLRYLPSAPQLSKATYPPLCLRLCLQLWQDRAPEFTGSPPLIPLRV